MLSTGATLILAFATFKAIQNSNEQLSQVSRKIAVFVIKIKKPTSRGAAWAISEIGRKKGQRFLKDYSHGVLQRNGDKILFA